jgi:oligopeptide/dipeptide ABC transporter ATP-binding protein
VSSAITQAVAAPFLVVRDLVKYYPVRVGLRRWLKVRSVDGVSLTVKQNEILGLVGESGCGKSTLARAILRLTRINSGSVTIDGQDMSKIDGEALRRFRRSVQIIFQDPFSALDPRMRIERSLTAPLAQHGIGSRAERAEQVRQMLASVGLDAGFCERYPSECSGGELQRIVIARALLLQPKLLVCDEPTAALDASVRAQLLDLLLDLKRRFGLTLLVISHDLKAVRYLCDRVAVMYLGQVVEITEREEFFERPVHPYSRALIAASWLEKAGLGRSSRILRGEPPSPINPPGGCRFHPRCPAAEAACTRDTPELEPVAEAHLARCHFRDRFFREGRTTAAHTAP